MPPIINGQSLITKSVFDIFVEAEYNVEFLPLTNLNHGSSFFLISDKLKFYLKIIFKSIFLKKIKLQTFKIFKSYLTFLF